MGNRNDDLDDEDGGDDDESGDSTISSNTACRIVIDSETPH